MLETKRLRLRAWTPQDAAALYEIAKDPRIGSPCGWPAHTSVQNSLEIIQNVFASPECYAVCLKNHPEPVGCIEIISHERSNKASSAMECEIGYWLSMEHWGKGYIPEAVQEALRHAFEDLNMETVWCGYYAGNEKSKRVQEKCGFSFHHESRKVEVKLLDEIRDSFVTCMTREDWQAQNKFHG